MPLLILTATVWLGRCHTAGNAGNPQPGRTQIVPFGRDHNSRASGPSPYIAGRRAVINE
jgi:hypothetical protein